MTHLFLSKEEIILLQQYGAKSCLELLRLKAHAILMWDQKMNVSGIANVIGRNPRTIHRWVKDFKDRRLASIFSGMVDNQHASKLTRVQKQEIQTTLQQPPDDYGLPKEF